MKSVEERLKAAEALVMSGQKWTVACDEVFLSYGSYMRHSKLYKKTRSKKTDAQVIKLIKKCLDNKFTSMKAIAREIHTMSARVEDAINGDIELFKRLRDNKAEYWGAMELNTATNITRKGNAYLRNGGDTKGFRAAVGTPRNRYNECKRTLKNKFSIDPDSL